MAKENCQKCGVELRAVEVVKAEVGVFGGVPQRQIDLVVACPDCGFRYYTFVDMDDLIAEDE